jgi:hypothetical protein
MPGLITDDDPPGLSGGRGSATSVGWAGEAEKEDEDDGGGLIEDLIDVPSVPVARGGFRRGVERGCPSCAAGGEVTGEL